MGEIVVWSQKEHFKSHEEMKQKLKQFAKRTFTKKKLESYFKNCLRVAMILLKENRAKGRKKGDRIGKDEHDEVRGQEPW